MGWVLSMAVVEGLSAEAVADRLEAELGGDLCRQGGAVSSPAGPSGISSPSIEPQAEVT